MLSTIVAVAKDNVIGSDSDMPWHIPEDLKRFREITSGKTIIMGRKTFQSLPKVLPKRHHVIITRDKNFTVDSEQVTIVHNLDDVLKQYKDCEEEAFIIGGGEIYNLLFPYSSKLYLTKINNSYKGDTYFPEINYDEWTKIYSSGEKINPEDNTSFEFINLIRKRGY
ncbi:MAG: dihydrofolate reductase [Clostridiaceae bacterium]|nr:dihydrofolate reductase [Clostridiaceae bacterium]